MSISLDRRRLPVLFFCAAALLAAAAAAAALGARDALGAAVFHCREALILVGSELSRRLTGLVALSGLVALGFVFAVGGLLRDRLAARRLENEARRRAEAVRFAGREIFLTSGMPQLAWTVGLFRPRIYVSGEAFAALPEAERLALVAHEESHARHHDLLKRLVLDLVRRAFFFIPAFGEAADAFRHGQEVRSDRDALKAAGRQAVAGLYLASERFRLAPAARSAAAFAFADPRLSEVLDDAAPETRFSPGKLAFSALMSCLVLAAGMTSLPRRVSAEEGSAMTCAVIETLAPRDFTPLIGPVELYTPMKENACRADLSC